MTGRRNETARKRDRARIAATNAACHICGKPIDYTIAWPDPMSFEADHVIAFSRGGADNLANKRASHRQCNRSKHARDHAPIIRRSRTLD